MADTTSERPAVRSGGTLLALGALGIVFGDIGTSPLYAFRESFVATGHELAPSEANVYGVLSLVFWSLVIVITIKYLTFVMRVTNDGEGGILALTALIRPTPGGDEAKRRGRLWLLVLVGLFGTALLYGDGMITPAISVLSAVEGAEVYTSSFDDFIIPIAIAILIGLFLVQYRGTHAVGRIFGPVMVVWFSVIGVIGLLEIVQEPQVLQALWPGYAVSFFADNGLQGFLALGSVFLVVTGGEALYADIGHFGHRPIALAWFALVLPGLLLNYFGQGALLLSDPSALENPFYRLVPEWGILPLVVLATAATVIASQALISGAFSLTMQASQLGYSPRLRIVHTSAEHYGQIYVPAVNWTLMVACVALVIGFRDSTNLAAAYGVAVTATMAITTVLFYVVARHVVGWKVWQAALLCSAFLVVDLAFFGANLPKIPHGGWFPLVVGVSVFTLLTTWHTGRNLIGERMRRGRILLTQFVASVAEKPPTRVPGTAVYLFSGRGLTPPSLVANLRSNRVLHERVLIVSVHNANVPHLHPVERLHRHELAAGFERIDIDFGFLDDPDVVGALQRLQGFDPEHTVYVLGRETVLVTREPGMAMWREHLFVFLSRNATSAARYFHLPPDKVFEVGTQVEL